MRVFADLVDEAKEAIVSANWDELKRIMTANFEQRRKLYTDQCLGSPGFLIFAVFVPYPPLSKYFKYVLNTKCA